MLLCKILFIKILIMEISLLSAADGFAANCRRRPCLVSPGYWFITAISPKGLPVLRRVFTESPATCLDWSVDSTHPVRPVDPKAALDRPSTSLLLSGVVK
jgi:hypothetical protein